MLLKKEKIDQLKPYIAYENNNKLTKDWFILVFAKEMEVLFFIKQNI